MSKALDLIAFEAFCREKGDAGYLFWSLDDDAECGCPATQFVHSQGLTLQDMRGMDIFDQLHDAACGALLGRPRTFSALASRLSALIREGGNV